MTWTLCPSLVVLRAEINALHPDRDKRTDGTISGYPGARSSHNVNAEGMVCALDVTVGDYEGGITPDQAEVLFEGIRLALRDQPRGITAYLIYNRRIASAGFNYEWQPYVGPGADPHTNHGHISTDWDILTGGQPSGLADYTTIMPWLGSTSKENDMGILEGITPTAMANLNGMVVSAVRSVLAPIAKRVAETQASVALQERLTVELYNRQGDRITPEELDQLKAAILEGFADGIKIEGSITATGKEPTA